MRMLNRNQVKTRVGILLLLTLPLFLASCVGWILEKPSFVLREITLSPRSFTEMLLLLGLDAHNPNRFDLTLKSLEFTLYLNQKEMGKGRLEKEILIPSSSITRLQAPVAASFKNLGESLNAVISGMTGKDVNYKIEGKANIKTIFGSYHFPFSKEGRIQ